MNKQTYMQLKALLTLATITGMGNLTSLPTVMWEQGHVAEKVSPQPKISTGQFDNDGKSVRRQMVNLISSCVS